MARVDVTSNRDLVSTNPAIAIGDCLCVVPGSGKLTKATPTELAAAGGVYGVAAADAAANSGATIAVHEFGEVPASVTGLSSGAVASAIVNASARIQRVSSSLPFQPGKDYLLGVVTSSGSVLMQPHRPYEAEGAGELNVKAFGAKGDGVTDDSAAFAAVFAAIPMENDGRGGASIFVPPGNYKLNSDLEITKCVVLRGAGPGGNSGTRLSFGSGKGLIVQATATSKNAGRPAGAVIDGFDIRGTRPTGIAQWAPSTAYAVGAKVENPDFQYGYAECISAGTSSSSSAILNSIPPAFDDTILFSNSLFMSVGTRVRVPGTFNLVYEVSTEGTTAASGTPSWPGTTGATVSSGTVVFTAIVSPFVQDGTCWWAGRVHSAVHMRTAARVNNCYIQDFHNAGVLIQASVPRTNANSWRLNEISISTCGMGVMCIGSDVNNGLATNVFVSSIGYMYSGALMAGNACHGFWDRAFLSSTWQNCGVETAKGRAFLSDVATNEGTFLGCYSENTQPSKISSRSVVVGGIFGSGFEMGFEGTRLHSSQSNAIRIVNNQATYRPEVFPAFTGAGSAVNVWRSISEVPGVYFGWRKGTSFEPTRSWGLGQIGAGQVQQNFISVCDGYGPDGMGWRDAFGHFRGFGGVVYPSYLFGVDITSETSEVLRGGKRTVGDRFEPIAYTGKRNAYLGKVVTSEGYRGRTWQPGFNPQLFSEGTPGLVVEPTAVNATGYAYRAVKYTGAGNTTEPAWKTTVGPDAAVWRASMYREIGELCIPNTFNGFYYKVSAVTADHKSGTTDPATIGAGWPTTIGATVGDGNVTWRCEGTVSSDAYTPDGGVTWVCLGPVAKFAPYAPIYEKASVKTSNNTSTVLDSYPLEDNATEHFEITVTAYQSSGSGSPSGASIRLNAAFMRTGGTVTQLGSTSTSALGNASLTASLSISGTSVLLNVVGLASADVQWKSRRLPQ